MSRYSIKFIAEQLAQFSTPGQIVSAVKQAGIKGRPKTTNSCPLARLLTIRYGSHFIVGQHFIVRRIHNSRTDKMDVDKITTPNPCAEFIKEFDSGKYPDIIDRSKTTHPRYGSGNTKRPFKSRKRGPGYIKLIGGR